MNSGVRSMRYFWVWIDGNQVEIIAACRVSAVAEAEKMEMCRFNSTIMVLEHFPTVH